MEAGLASMENDVPGKVVQLRPAKAKGGEAARGLLRLIKDDVPEPHAFALRHLVLRMRRDLGTDEAVHLLAAEIVALRKEQI